VSDTQSARLHFERLARLSKALEARGFSIYEHQYHAFVFGSFRLELGTRRRRWSVAWDGRDGFLTISDRYGSDDSLKAPPTTLGTHHLGVDDPEAPFRFLATFGFGE
jgi:hypothetical protein